MEMKVASDRNASPYSKRAAVRAGAASGVVLTFAYGLVTCLYAIVRSSLAIHASIGFNAGWSTVLMNASSLILSTLVFCMLMSIFTAPLGMITALLVRAVLLTIKPRCTPGWSSFMGMITAFCLWLLLFLVLKAALGARLSWRYPETLMFWLVLPGIIYVLTTGFQARRLRSLL